MGKSMRPPAVAGYFYPADKKELEAMIADWKKDASAQTKNFSLGVVLPHAGYFYSGVVAARTIFSTQLRNTAIILGPNHTGLGLPYSVMTEGSWQTPLGEVEIDSAIAQRIVQGSQFLKTDTLAHDSEHSIEVIVPFLQSVNSFVKIVPIVIAQAPGEIYKKIGHEIARIIIQHHWQNQLSILASSDMTHFESHESAQRKDFLAIESMIQLDTDELLNRVQEYRISMCGVGPVVIMLEIVKQLGARHGQLIKYQTSGDVTGDRSSVVGYAGLTVN